MSIKGALIDLLSVAKQDIVGEIFHISDNKSISKYSFKMRFFKILLTVSEAYCQGALNNIGRTFKKSHMTKYLKSAPWNKVV